MFFKCEINRTYKYEIYLYIIWTNRWCLCFSVCSQKIWLTLAFSAMCWKSCMWHHQMISNCLQMFWPLIIVTSSSWWFGSGGQITARHFQTSSQHLHACSTTSMMPFLQLLPNFSLLFFLSFQPHPALLTSVIPTVLETPDTLLLHVLTKLPTLCLCTSQLILYILCWVTSRADKVHFFLSAPWYLLDFTKKQCSDNLNFVINIFLQRFFLIKYNFGVFV